MILITGGAFQGKLDYALKKYNLTENDISENSSDFSKKILNNFEKFIEYCFINKIDFLKFIPQLQDKIIITCETGCGIIPVVAEKRALREYIGRINCILAEKSDSVVRVCCGLGIELKY